MEIFFLYIQITPSSTRLEQNLRHLMYLLVSFSNMEESLNLENTTTGYASFRKLEGLEL